MAAIKRPTRKELDEWVALEEKRLSLNRQASDIAALQEVIEDKCLQYVRDVGGAERVAICNDFRLEIALHRNKVEWKSEYLRTVPNGAKKAEKLIKAAGTKEVLKIEPPKKQLLFE